VDTVTFFVSCDNVCLYVETQHIGLPSTNRGKLLIKVKFWY